MATLFTSAGTALHQLHQQVLHCIIHISRYCTASVTSAGTALNQSHQQVLHCISHISRYCTAPVTSAGTALHQSHRQVLHCIIHISRYCAASVTSAGTALHQSHSRGCTASNTSAGTQCHLQLQWQRIAWCAVLMQLYCLCSMSGHRLTTRPNTHFYGATKHAVRALTEGLRMELRAANSHIRVSVSLSSRHASFTLINYSLSFASNE